MSARLSFTSALAPFFLSRVFFFTLVLLATGAKTVEESNNFIQLEVRLNSPWTSVEERVLGADASWYKGIAEDGYTPGPYREDKQYNWAFFPLTSVALFAGQFVIGDYFLASLLICNLLFFCSLVLLHRLATAIGYSTKNASRMQWMLAFFPTSYFLSLPVSEPFFLILVLGSFLAIERKAILLSGVLMALAGVTRATGLLLLPAYLLRLHEKKELFTRAGLAAVLKVPLPAACFFLYLHTHTGNALAWKDIQVTWGRFERSPLELFSDLLNSGDLLVAGWNFYLLDTLAAVFGLIVTISFLFRKRYAWAAVVGVPLLAALSTGSVLSAGRFLVVLFPIYFYLLRAEERITLAIFCLLFGILSLLYALGVTAAMA